MPANSLEDVMKDQIKKLNDLEMATNFIRRKTVSIPIYYIYLFYC